jgi:3-carboxy-cis,cis-muconate cycloisomerase
MQAGDRIVAWRDPLNRARRRLAETVTGLCTLQMGGATGTLDGRDGKWPAVKERMGIALGLEVSISSWHSQRDRLVAFADSLALISGSLGKFGQDVALMAQDEIGEIALAGGGTSSAMPHKTNPIAAEILVVLARFSAVQISAMHHAMVHEQERSGAAWTLEWMVLPQICVAAAAGLATAARLIADVRNIGHAAAD